MMMYEELVKSLRLCREILHEDDSCIEFVDGSCEAFPICAYQLMEKAADAIEELQAQLMYSNDAAKAIAEKVPQWVRAEEQLPPPAEIQEYLVRVRSGGPDYGGYDYDYDFATWGEVYWCKDGSVTYEWTSIMNGRVGAVEITHWMPLPEPPKEGE